VTFSDEKVLVDPKRSQEEEKEEAVSKSNTNSTGKSRKLSCPILVGESDDPEEYSYVYCDSTSPALMIRLSGDPGVEDDDSDDDDDEGNIYEEIKHPEVLQEKELVTFSPDPETNFLLGISAGRRRNLSLYKFADWDDDLSKGLEEGTGKSCNQIRTTLSSNIQYEKISGIPWRKTTTIIM